MRFGFIMFLFMNFIIVSVGMGYLLGPEFIGACVEGLILVGLLASPLYV